MDIISLIIIIAIIKKVIEKDKEKKKGHKQKTQGYANCATQQSYVDSVAQQRTQSYADRVAQQRATKERLERKYGSVNSKPAYQKVAAPKTDILTRAKANVKEEAPDTFKQQAHAEVCAEYRSHAETAPDLKAHQRHSAECNPDGESDIIKRVNDLIVMGYDGAMQFDRDFIAEGVEMLNSFNL